MIAPVSKRVATGLMAMAWFMGASVVPGGAAAGPYEQAVSYHTASPDRLGTGAAWADASATRAGALSVQASATSNAPAGAVFEGYAYTYTGGSRAAAYALVQQNYYDVTPGPRGARVTFDLSSFSSTSTSQGTIIYGASRSSGSVTAAVGVYVYVYPCGRSQTCGSSHFGFDYQPVTYTRPFVSTLAFNAPAGSKVFLQAYFYLIAQAVGGSASASGSMSGTVSNIEIF